MIARRPRKGYLLAASALCGLGLMTRPAAADVDTVIAIDPGQLLSGSVTASDAGDSLGVIVSLLDDTGSTAVPVTDGSSISVAIAVGPDVVLNTGLDGSSITAVARGNASLSLLGILPSAPDDPPGAAVAGAGIFTGGVLRSNSLSAATQENLVELTATIGAAAIVTADLDSTLVFADGIFNSAVASIETLPSVTLRAPAGPAAYHDFGTVLVTTSASLSVANTQVNADFSADDGQPQGATAATLGNRVALDLQGDGGAFFAGLAGLAGNEINTRAVGNRSDGSVLLRNEIATSEGPLAGPAFFDGTVLVYSLQNSDDLNDPDQNFLGAGIVALASDNEIVGTVVAGDLGQDGAAIDSFQLDLTGNLISAAATINAQRSEISFEPALSLQGSGAVLDQGAGDASVLLQERLGRRFALADYLIVSRQSTNRREVVDPVAYALLDDNRIAGQLETPAAFAALVLEGNALTALAEGNNHQALLDNRLDAAEGETAAMVAGTLAIINWQWISAPEIAAGIAGSGQAITAEMTLLSPAGDQSARLSMIDSVFSARASGNAAVAQVVFSAGDLALVLATDGPAGSVANAGATLFSDYGATNAGDSFSASAGGVVANYQILDSAAADHRDQDYLIAGVRAEVLDSAIVGTLAISGGRAIDAELVLDVEMDRNMVEARATGNRFQDLAQLQSGGRVAGSFGQLSVQIDNDQSVAAAIVDSGLFLTLDASAFDGGDIAASVTLNDNSLLSVATINLAGVVTSVEAGTLTAGGWSSLYDATVPGQSLGGVIEGYQFNAFRVTRHTAFANAAFAVLNDQTTDEGDADALLDGSGIVVELLSAPQVPLENVALQSSGNRLVAQARLNDATSNVFVDVKTLAEIDPAESPGPLAGIVSYQGSGQGYVADVLEPDLVERESHAMASVLDSGITVQIPALSSSIVEVTGNLLAATASANVAASSVQLSAVALHAGLDVPAGVAIVDNDNGTDFDLQVLGSVFIANSQRNEWQLFGGGPGPSVTAVVDGGTAIRVVSDGELLDSLVTLSGNALVGEARANVAQNTIVLSAVVLEASGQIVSRQGNSGDVTAAVTDGAILLELNAGGGVDASEASGISVENNAIQTLALGNAVLNDITATAAGSFQGFVGGPATIVEDLPATTGETTVEADYAILNRQVNAGTEDRAVEIASSVVGAQIGVNVNGNHDATVVTMSGNSIAATAYGNSASNGITLRAAGGDMPSSAIVNQQNNSFANISATVSGSGYSLNLTGGGVGGGVIGGSNSISATAVGNSAVNTMVSRSGGPGPSN